MAQEGHAEIESMEGLVRILIQDRAKMRKHMTRLMETQQQEDEIARERAEIHEYTTRLMEVVGQLYEEKRWSLDREVVLEIRKMSEDDDIETYLTAFERVMTAYEVDKFTLGIQASPTAW